MTKDRMKYLARLNHAAIENIKEEIKECAQFIRDLVAGKIELGPGETVEDYKSRTIQIIKYKAWDIRDRRKDIEYYSECIENSGDEFAMHRLGC